MKYQFIRVNALDPSAGQEEFNRFCSSHSLAAVEKHFVAAGNESYWSFCIQYVDAPANRSEKKQSIDYREVLSPEDFAIYAKLRSLRKAFSEKDGTPLYAIFTNAQLAAMVEGRTLTEAELLRVNGVGRARVEKYGGAFIAKLREELEGAGREAGQG